MGLDATVYCDCFEQGRLRVQPKPEWGVGVEPEGYRSCSTQISEEVSAFFEWSRRHACEHEDGVLLHHRLGNVSLIGFLGEAFSSRAEQLPVLCTKVIYGGSHCGDYLALDEVASLARELDTIAQIHGESSEDERLIRDFEQQLRELTACALRVSKPIAF